METIRSRDHARIDVCIAAGLAGTALAPGVTAGIRAAAAFGAVGLTSLSAMTDYEGGLFPTLSLSQHRAVEAGIGTALCAWGLRRAGRGGGWALALAGSAQVALALTGSRGRDEGPPETLYRPIDTPKPLADGIWIVDGTIGPGLPVRMTVIRLQSGGLLLYSPTRYSPALRQALEALGPIRHLVAASTVHWVFVKDWQTAVPGVTSWVAPGLAQRGQVRRARLRIDHELAETPPAVWAGEIEQEVVRGAASFAEVAMFHRPSRTAMFADLVQNIEAHKLPWLLRPLGRALGNLAPEGRAPTHYRALVRAGGSGQAAARRIVAWAPERIVVAHGLPIEQDAAAYLRQSLAWLAR